MPSMAPTVSMRRPSAAVNLPETLRSAGASPAAATKVAAGSTAWPARVAVNFVGSAAAAAPAAPMVTAKIVSVVRMYPSPLLRLMRGAYTGGIAVRCRNDDAYLTGACYARDRSNSTGRRLWIAAPASLVLSLSKHGWAGLIRPLTGCGRARRGRKIGLGSRGSRFSLGQKAASAGRPGWSEPRSRRARKCAPAC